jgi:hypothetical protein
MIETDQRLLQGTRFTASPQISLSVAGTQTECSPSQEPANRKADLARLQSAVAELLCTINIRRRGNRTLSEQRIWIAAEQVDLELRDVVVETPVLMAPCFNSMSPLPARLSHSLHRSPHTHRIETEVHFQPHGK